ncbi:hypothetical protein D3C84_458570 [compost metagenome]
MRYVAVRLNAGGADRCANRITKSVASAVIRSTLHNKKNRSNHEDQSQPSVIVFPQWHALRTVLVCLGPGIASGPGSGVRRLCSQRCRQRGWQWQPVVLPVARRAVEIPPGQRVRALHGVGAARGFIHPRRRLSVQRRGYGPVFQRIWSYPRVHR